MATNCPYPGFAAASRFNDGLYLFDAVIPVRLDGAGKHPDGLRDVSAIGQIKRRLEVAVRQ
jgi:hypothetical protein